MKLIRTHPLQAKSISCSQLLIKFIRRKNFTRPQGDEEKDSINSLHMKKHFKSSNQ